MYTDLPASRGLRLIMMGWALAPLNQSPAVSDALPARVSGYSCVRV